MANVTISMRCRSCNGAFEQLCLDQKRSKREDDAVLLRPLQHQFGRFQIWAGDAGATETGRASLEHQLQDSEDLYQAVVDLLDDLHSQLLKRSSLLLPASQFLNLTLFPPSHWNLF